LDDVRGEGPFRSFGEKFASGEATPSDIQAYVTLQGQVYYWSWILRRLDDDGEADVIELTRQALRRAIRDVVAGPDDTWSGRQNDVARIRMDGVRKFVQDVIWAGVTTDS